MGQLSFGVDNSNQMTCIFVQMVNGTRKVVGPPLAQTEEFELVDPFPTWEERVFVRTFNGKHTPYHDYDSYTNIDQEMPLSGFSSFSPY